MQKELHIFSKRNGLLLFSILLLTAAGFLLLPSSNAPSQSVKILPAVTAHPEFGTADPIDYMHEASSDETPTKDQPPRDTDAEEQSE